MQWHLHVRLRCALRLVRGRGLSAAATAPAWRVCLTRIGRLSPGRPSRPSRAGLSALPARAFPPHQHRAFPSPPRGRGMIAVYAGLFGGHVIAGPVPDAGGGLGTFKGVLAHQDHPDGLRDCPEGTWTRVATSCRPASCRSASRRPASCRRAGCRRAGCRMPPGGRAGAVTRAGTACSWPACPAARLRCALPPPGRSRAYLHPGRDRRVRPRRKERPLR